MKEEKHAVRHAVLKHYSLTVHALPSFQWSFTTQLTGHALLPSVCMQYPLQCSCITPMITLAACMHKFRTAVAVLARSPLGTLLAARYRPSFLLGVAGGWVVE